MKKTLIFLLCFIFCFGCLSFAKENRTCDNGEARLQYNSFNNKYEYVRHGDVLKYNQFEDTHEYTNPDATIKYNQYENEYQYVDPPCKTDGTGTSGSSYTNPKADPDYDPY